MTSTKVQKAGITDGSIGADQIEDGTIIASDIEDGSITNAKLTNSSFTLNGSSVSLGGSVSISVFVDWQSVITADGSTTTTAVAGQGYFIDTTSASHTINLPSSPSAGDTIAIKDYAGTFGTNGVTIGRNSENIQGAANDNLLSTNRASVVLVYFDATKGWLYTEESNVGDLGNFTQATGGTVTTSGDYKIHTFTGDGCFAVSNVGFGGNVDYLVVAGGGGAGAGPGVNTSGGGGGGGYRESSGTSHGCYTTSPLGSGVPALSITATTYPVTVGGGGSGSSCASTKGSSGSNSSFSTITAAGGGGGGSNLSRPGGNGGSGGGGAGGAYCQLGGSGNTPPVSPPQGSDGGQSSSSGPDQTGGGGGGATEVGANGASPGCSGPSGRGGAGATTSISGSSLSYSGGGGAGGSPSPWTGGIGAASPCGTGGAGSNFYTPDKTHNDGTANRGGGGGGISGCVCGGAGGEGGGDGGKGIVIIRYKYQ